MAGGLHNRTKFVLSSSDELRAGVKIVLIFFIGCFLGWCYETLNDFICGRGFMFRASFMMPLCPIYGIGTVVISLLLHDVVRYEEYGKKTPIIVALYISVLVTLVELIGSYFCEHIMGYVPWDYSDYFLNFEGRIAMKSTMIFVVGGMFVLYVLMKPLDSFVEEYDINISFSIASLLFIMFLIDIFFDSIGVWTSLKVELMNAHPDIVSLQGYEHLN